MLAAICRSAALRPSSRQRALEQQRLRQDIDRQKKPQTEIGCERQLARRRRSEPFEREMAVEKINREVNDRRSDDWLGVDHKLLDQPPVRERQARPRRACRRTERHNRNQRRHRKRCDDRTGRRRRRGDADHDGESQAMARRGEQGERAALVPRAHMRGKIVASRVSDRHERRQRQKRRRKPEIEPCAKERKDGDDRDPDHRNIAGVEAGARSLAIFVSAGELN